VQQAERRPDTAIEALVVQFLEPPDPDIDAVAPPGLGRQPGRAVEGADLEPLPLNACAAQPDPQPKSSTVAPGASRPANRFNQTRSALSDA